MSYSWSYYTTVENPENIPQEKYINGFSFCELLRQQLVIHRNAFGSREIGRPRVDQWKCWFPLAGFNTSKIILTVGEICHTIRFNLNSPEDNFEVIIFVNEKEANVLEELHYNTILVGERFEHEKNEVIQSFLQKNKDKNPKCQKIFENAILKEDINRHDKSIIGGESHYDKMTALMFLSICVGSPAIGRENSLVCQKLINTWHKNFTDLHRMRSNVFVQNTYMYLMKLAGLNFLQVSRNFLRTYYKKGICVHWMQDLIDFLTKNEKNFLCVEEAANCLNYVLQILIHETHFKKNFLNTKNILNLFFSLLEKVKKEDLHKCLKQLKVDICTVKHHYLDTRFIFLLANLVGISKNFVSCCREKQTNFFQHNDTNCNYLQDIISIQGKNANPILEKKVKSLENWATEKCINLINNSPLNLFSFQKVYKLNFPNVLKRNFLLQEKFCENMFEKEMKEEEDDKKIYYYSVKPEQFFHFILLKVIEFCTRFGNSSENEYLKEEIKLEEPENYDQISKYLS